MERAIAMKKLGKLLGKNFGYRVDPSAPSAEERAEAKLRLPALSAATKQAEEAMEARRKAILAADVEYQALIVTYKEARKQSSAASSASHHFKFTVGVSSSIFFHVKAQGDSWEDVIAKLNGGAR